MLKLAKGEYTGMVSHSFAADGLTIALTNYQGAYLHSPLHSHENAHLSFSLKGEVIVGRKRHTGVKNVVERLSYIRSGEQHQTHVTTESGKNVNLELEPAFFRSYNLEEVQLEHLTTSPGTSLVMLRLLNELHCQDAMFRDNVHFLVLSMLQKQSQISRRGAPAWITVVRELLRDNWDKETSLQQIAAVAGVHAVTVSKHFSRYFGCTLGEYRRRLKLERALSMMTGSNVSLTEIAYACGFFDQSHFIRTFKASTGFLPRRLRHI